MNNPVTTNPYKESDQSNNWEHHRPGNLCIYMGDGGERWYVIRERQETDGDPRYYKGHKQVMVGLQLICGDDRTINNNGSRKRIIQKGAGAVKVVDRDMYMQYIAQRLEHISACAEERMEQPFNTSF